MFASKEAVFGPAQVSSSSVDGGWFSPESFPPAAFEILPWYRRGGRGVSLNAIRNCRVIVHHCPYVSGQFVQVYIYRLNVELLVQRLHVQSICSSCVHHKSKRVILDQLELSHLSVRHCI